MGCFGLFDSSFDETKIAKATQTLKKQSLKPFEL
jgi:hypothetical protein